MIRISIFFYQAMILIPDYYFKAAKKLDENGNPQANTPSSGGSVSFSARQLKPLSIYRHNPAFHSQHVSVNQMDEIPSLSPTSLQPPSQIPSTSCNDKDDPKKMSSKLSRRKKKVATSQQCGNFRIFLSFRFYVNLILENLEVLKLPFLPFWGLWILSFC